MRIAIYVALIVLTLAVNFWAAHKATQAVDLRNRPVLGTGTSGAYELVRERVPFTDMGDALPQDLEPVRELIRSGAFSA